MERDQENISPLLGNRPSYLSLATTVIYLKYTNEEVNADLKKMRKNPHRLFDAYGAGSTMYHETVHFWQTFYNYQLAQIGVYKRANIFWLRQQLLAKDGKIELPLHKEFQKWPFKIEGLLDDVTGAIRLSLRDLLEGEATFQTLMSCSGFGTYGEVESFFRKIKERKKPELERYWKAFDYVSERMANYSLTSFPMTCHFALAGAKIHGTQLPISPLTLFKDLIDFLIQNPRLQCTLHEIGLYDLGRAYKGLIDKFCSEYGLSYYGPCGVALQVLNSGILNYAQGSGECPWAPLTQIAAKLCEKQNSDLFFSPINTGTTSILFQELGQPLMICEKGEPLEAYYDPDKPEQETGYVITHASYKAFESLFTKEPFELRCPHKDCPYQVLALCYQFPWVPTKANDCLFPQIFQGVYGLSLDRFERIRN